jgi:hypothetical protein
VNYGIIGNDVEFVAYFKVLSPVSVGGLRELPNSCQDSRSPAEIGTRLWRRWCEKSDYGD